MVDQIISKQQLIDAGKNADSWEKYWAGSDDENVITRLNKIYPTHAKALKILMENGGLQPFETQAQLLASVPVVSPTAAKALDTKKVWIWKQTSAEGIEPKVFEWVDTGLSELDQADKNLDARVGQALSAIIPIAVGPSGKIPLWLNGGRLGFTEFEAKTRDRVKAQLGLGGLASQKVIPIAIDKNGKIPIWLQNGMLNFAGIHIDAVERIKDKLGPSGGASNNVTDAAYPIVSDSASLRQWKAKAAKLKSGLQQQLRIVMTGDSWTEHKTITNEVLTFVRAAFGEAGSGWINLGVENNQLDNISVTKNGTWSYADLNLVSSFANGSGPDGFTLTSTASGNTFTVSNLAKGDQLTVFFGKTDGSFKYSLNGGAETTITATSTGSAVQSAMIPVAGVSEIVFTTVSGTIALFGMHLRKTTGSGVEITKLGNGGSTGQDFLKISPTVQSNFANYLKPDVVVIILGTNDYRYGHSVENFKAGISAIIDGYRTNNANCGVILIAPAQSNAPAVIPLSKYRDAIYELAQTKKAEFYNMYDDWDSYSAENANGQWADAYHVSQAGAYRIASKLFKSFFEV